MYLNPEKLNREQRIAVDRWLVANGCRHHVALEPVIIAGNWVHYRAACRRDRTQDVRVDERGWVRTTAAKVRIRVPLRDFMPRPATRSDLRAREDQP